MTKIDHQVKKSLTEKWDDKRAKEYNSNNIQCNKVCTYFNKHIYYDMVNATCPIPKYKRPQGMTGASIKWGNNARKYPTLASRSSPKGMFQQEYEHIVTKPLTSMVEL